MYLLYSLLLTGAFLFFLPWFAYQAFVNRKYVNNLRERLGRLPAAWQADARPTLWIQAVSVGEALTARPLVSALRARFPQHRLIVSTTTGTGQAVARSAEADGVCYFPFDWRFAVRRALTAIRPEAVILLESELWPNFLRECEWRRIPVLVANGRISDRSFHRSVKVSGILRPLLYRKVTRWLMQSAVDAERAVKLGAPPERVSVSGNLKYDIGETKPTPQSAANARFLDETFALSRSPLIIAGSTTEGEEALVLAAFAAVRKASGLENVRLLLAPRHPERFAAVAQLLETARCRFVRRSAYAALAVASTGNSSQSPTEMQRRQEAQTAEVILLDSIGELAALYALASVVFIGGSLAPKGGHNVLEPALYARPVIVGPHMENFREIAAEFQRRAALWRLQSAESRELSAALIELLTQPARAHTLGANARAAIDENRGATARTVEAIAALLAER